MELRNLTVKPADKPKPEPVVVAEAAAEGACVDIPKGSFLYGIKLKTGEYKKVVASSLGEAAAKLGISFGDIKRGMPIHGSN